VSPADAFEIDAAREERIDAVLADSFPASDPPPWTPAIARLGSPRSAALRAGDAATDTLKPGDLLPHFIVTDLDGRKVDYSSSIWQRKQLVLVMLPDDGPSSHSYAQQLIGRAHDDETAWLVTRDRIAGLPTPGAIVADRWGEVIHVAYAPGAADLPPPDELVEWADYVQHRCPECEGEAR
jgi:hypothetical protein